MNELMRMMATIGQVGFLLGALGFGFALILKGVAPKAGSPMLRGSAYVAGGSLLILIVSGGLS